MFAGNRTRRTIRAMCLCVLAVLASASLQGADGTADGADGWFPFAPPDDSFGQAALDVGAMLNEKVAGSRGRVVARGGDLVFEKTGEKARFWGVVAEPWSWPKTKPEIDRLSRILAKAGVNLVRLHVPRGNAEPTDFTDTVHYMVHSLKKRGIYVYLLWYCTACDGPRTNLFYFSPEHQELHKTWARGMLGSTNPYTGIPLAKDPAVVALELLDEDSLFFWTFNPNREALKPAMPILEARFGAWLTARYGSLNKTLAAWGKDKYPKGDDIAAGRVALYNAGELTGNDWAVASRNERRAGDQARFMAELMRDWYVGMKTWLRDELGYDGLIVGSNWKTADERVLGPLDQYANLGVDVTARNTYFAGPCTGPRSSYRVQEGQFYRDRSLLKEPEQAILMHIQCADHPHMMTEGGWAMPNRFRTEEPFLIAGYFSLQGIDGYCAFRVQPNWLGKHEKWPILTPAGAGQYPAASIVYRRGYIQEGPVVINDALALGELFALKGASLSQPLGLDAVQAARVPQGARAEVASLPGVDPLSFYVGRVVRTIAEKPGKSTFTNTTKLIDRTRRIVRSATGELSLDYGKGIATMNAPCAQGAAGFLQASGAVELSGVTVDLDNEYASVMAVSLDGNPIDESARILLQVITEEQNTGWQTKPARKSFTRDAPEQDCLEIVSTGPGPIRVRKIAGSVSFKRSDATSLNVTALDFQGYARQQLQGGARSLTLLPDCLYYIIEE
jgi:hypothetical protein